MVTDMVGNNFTLSEVVISSSNRQIPTISICNKIGCNGPNKTAESFLLIVEEYVLKQLVIKRVDRKISNE